MVLEAGRIGITCAGFYGLLKYGYTVPTRKTTNPGKPNKTQREKGDNPSKRGSSLDQTQSSEFAGQKEEGENHPGDDHGA